MTYVVSAKWIARPGEEEEVARCIAAIAGPSRAEPGNLMYQPHRDASDPRVFFFYEQYTDEAAYQAHLASPHVKAIALGNAIPRLEARIREFYTLIEP